MNFVFLKKAVMNLQVMIFYSKVHSPDTTAELLRISSVKACAHDKEKIREASATLVCIEFEIVRLLKF